MSWLSKWLAPATTAEPIPSTAMGEALANELAQVPGYRVLRALAVVDEVDILPSPRSGERVAVVVDTETTGLDPAADRMIELAAQRFLFDAQGHVRIREHPKAWLEDPQTTLSPRIARLTGLSDAILAGKQFDTPTIIATLGEADLIIAHNAAFDRPFLDARFPGLSARAWACSLAQLDWLELGFDGRALGHLLLQRGWYFEGHRAENDVRALTQLLAEPLADGRTILARLLDQCEADSLRIDAVGAPFEAKDLLRSRGYRWNAQQRCWWREIPGEQRGEESDWLDQIIYRGRGGPAIRVITARERFARFD